MFSSAQAVLGSAEREALGVLAKLRRAGERIVRAPNAAGTIQALRGPLDTLLLAQGKLLAHHARTNATSLREAEFKIFSQFGEDGAIQYLLAKTPIENETFVEFGVEDYSESNTRFLLMNDNWRGLIIDAGSAHLDFTAAHQLRWRFDLTPLSSFVTPENINRLIMRSGFDRDLGLLSVDIDGNDYWVLQAIDVVVPRILVVEYNSTFGPHLSVTVPPNDEFDRSKAHWSHLYFGASLSAYSDLLIRKGYQLVGCNAAGNNAFFVRRDVGSRLPNLSVADAYVESRFAESRSAAGELDYVRPHLERLKRIQDCTLFDLRRGEQQTIRDLYGLSK